MLWKWYIQYANKFGKLSSGHRTGKVQFSFQSQRKAMPNNYCAVALISHVSKIMLKILQARLQYYVNWDLPNVQAGFRKGRGTIDQTANIIGSQKKLENSRKTSTSASLGLRGRRRAERSYSTLKVRRGDLIQGKEQLGFGGAAVKRYPTTKVRETQVRW